jgi:ribosome-binding factor A
MPELIFFVDDSLDYIENIDAALRGEDENPIQDPTILSNKKKK